MTARRYSVQFRPAALRQLRKIPRDALRRIQAATETLRDEPRPEGAAKLAGTNDLWRIWVGDYRVVSSIPWLAHMPQPMPPLGWYQDAGQAPSLTAWPGLAGARPGGGSTATTRR